MHGVSRTVCDISCKFKGISATLVVMRRKLKGPYETVMIIERIKKKELIIKIGCFQRTKGRTLFLRLNQNLYSQTISLDLFLASFLLRLGQGQEVLPFYALGIVSTCCRAKPDCVSINKLVLLEGDMGIYLSTPKTDKFSEDGENHRLRFGLSSMQGWRATMEDAHAALPDLDDCTSFFGVYDGHGGKVVAKFCAKFLHTQVLKNEAYSSGDISTSVQKAFLRMDGMMQGQRGWRELAVLGDKINKFTGMIEGFIWSPRGSDSNNNTDDWAAEEVRTCSVKKHIICAGFYGQTLDKSRWDRTISCIAVSRCIYILFGIAMKAEAVDKLAAYTDQGPHADFSGPTSGCTACVAIVRYNQLVVANAGDSRCVISRKGQAYNLSRDHKPELEVERERILRAGGFIHGGRINGSLNLARAIGDMEFKQNKFLPAEKQIVTANPDVNIVELCDDDDFIVVACDGIWDCMSSQQLVDFVHEHINKETSLSVVCEKVLDRCLAPTTLGEGCDNMTMILVQFKKPISSKALVVDRSTDNVPESETQSAG
ncbi:hypothetical protein ZIOFF_015224 [Zingiber officinale]|uniref:protein-serine/threonine phosphatase n=1 Tax=Zingiber officinale TaxID=94328 RepID=A0A8J5LQ36_ZINOF|nr:hypothetical protein ZIOFF_015224 [Zingiber officinale]